MKWLTAAELDSWLSVVRLLTWLPWSIDQQLQRDSNLRMVEYQVLAMLSTSPERTMRMSSLAEVTNASLSRLSHLVKRLEGRRPRAPGTRSDRRTIHQCHPDREGLPNNRRSGARARGTRAIARHRRPVARAATAPRPRRGPHRVTHRHLRNQLTSHQRAEPDVTPATPVNHLFRPTPRGTNRISSAAGRHLAAPRSAASPCRSDLLSWSDAARPDVGRMRLYRQATQPEPDAVQPDQGRDAMGHQRLADPHPGDGRPRRGFGSPSKRRHESHRAVAAQGHDSAYPVRSQREPQLVFPVNVEERRDVEILAGYRDPVLVGMHDVCMPLAVRVVHLGDDAASCPLP